METLDGNQFCEGVFDPETAFSAEVCLNITSKAARRELEKTVKVFRKKVKEKPDVHEKVREEIIQIVEHDWLTKISLKRWGRLEWNRHLEARQDTLDKRKQNHEYRSDLEFLEIQTSETPI